MYLMRIIYRDIVGGFIFSKDGKLLLGKNRKGGVYEGSFVVPSGGVDEGETKEAALYREMLEETSIVVKDYKISFLRRSFGENEKTLNDTGERVFVKMDFYSYRIDISENSDNIIINSNDDLDELCWVDIDQLDGLALSEPTRETLQLMEIIKS